MTNWISAGLHAQPDIAQTMVSVSARILAPIAVRLHYPANSHSIDNGRPLLTVSQSENRAFELHIGAVRVNSYHRKSPRPPQNNIPTTSLPVSILALPPQKKRTLPPKLTLYFN